MIKRTLSMIALAILSVGLLGSCSKINERIDGVEKRVESIESEKIASIENQIAAINSSIADLGAIKKDILDLQIAVGAKGEDISELRAADEALDKRIDALEAHAGDLSKYAEKDWASATFATLEQLDSTKKDLSALEEKVNKFGETFDGKLSELKTNLTNSINSAINGVNASISALEARVSALEQMIQSVSITSAYSDGSVEAVDSILTLKCIVNPAEALIGMKSLKDSLVLYADSVKVKTKTGTSAYMEIKVSEATVTDTKQGAITLTADISEYLPKEEDKTLAVAVNIKNGISDFTTEFVVVDNIPGYKVTFSNNYGETPVTRDTAVLKGSKINKPADPTRDGHFFDKWFTKKFNSDEKEVDWNFEAMTVSQDTTLYAEWIKGAKVTFYKDTVNLTVCMDTVVRPNTMVNKPAADPDSTGYAFKGWFTRKTDGTFGDEWNFNTNVDKDTTLYAKWAKVMTVAQLVATNSEFPVSNSLDVIPENVWLNANNDSCYFVTGEHIKFMNKTRGGSGATAITYTPDYKLTRQDDGSYQSSTGTLKFVMASDRDSVVKITLQASSTTTFNGDYTPQPGLPAGALKGEFSVSATKKVHFSQGNLYVKKDDSGNWNWHFYDKQYACNSLNSTLTWQTNTERPISKDDNESDLFSWGYGDWSKSLYSPSFYVKGYDNPDNDCEQFSKTEDWGYAFGGESSVWRTLNVYEWEYLFGNSTERNGRYKCGVTVCGHPNCVVLLPDNWKWEGAVGTEWQKNTMGVFEYSDSEKLTVKWSSMEAAGAVCLPSAGYSTGAKVRGVELYGAYWTSSGTSEVALYEEYYDGSDYAHYLWIANGKVYFYDGSERKQGNSVRLVTDVPAK